MTHQPKVTAYIDSAGKHRERISAANGEPLYVTSEGYESEDDMLIAGELVRRAKNEQYYGDAAHRARIDALMARRDAASAQYPYGTLAAALALPTPKRNALLDAPANVGAPPMNSLRGAVRKQDW